MTDQQAVGVVLAILLVGCAFLIWFAIPKGEDE